MTLLDTNDGRAALRCALSEALSNVDREPNPRRWPIGSFDHVVVYDAITDPAKLVELMANEVRRLGVHEPGDAGSRWFVFAHGPGVIEIRGFSWIAPPGVPLLGATRRFWCWSLPSIRHVTVPQACAILAGLLQIPSPCRETVRSPDEYPSIERCVRCGSALRAVDVCLDCLERARAAAEKAIRGDV